MNEQIIADLKDAADRYPSYRPEFVLTKDETGEDILNGPEVRWYSSNGGEDAFYRLEGICSQIVSQVTDSSMPKAIGWQKVPEKGLDGPRHNHSGRVLLWSLRSSKSIHSRFAGKSSPVQTGGTYHVIRTLDNAFLIIRDALQLKLRKPEASPDSTAFELMMSEFGRNPKSAEWTADRWAKFTGRSKSTVQETQAWTLFKPFRDQRDAKKHTDQKV